MWDKTKVFVDSSDGYTTFECKSAHLIRFEDSTIFKIVGSVNRRKVTQAPSDFDHSAGLSWVDAELDTAIHDYLTSPTGKKYSDGKRQYSLLPTGVVVQVIDVLMGGMDKYGRDNWKGVDQVEYFDAAHRHLDAWVSGQKTDKDTGLHHLAHAICCQMFMLWMDDHHVNNVNIQVTYDSSEPPPEKLITETQTFAEKLIASTQTCAEKLIAEKSMKGYNE